ncbi:hypothetical protein K490DRAFT_62617 [Saccharata proteae CBS 121410]|uniref:Tat pathway signal sequence n=1 Tax=Saccharata proteae CBS 121410 TaxID=1314787 RepID=A0A9P4I2G6_9PEZI|nr:hypothetical protein K490DRAFT_62617 [Saccharata proteae CBS 121410]
MEGWFSRRALRAAAPAERRISLPVGERLSAIMENDHNKPPVPPRSPFRKIRLDRLEAGSTKSYKGSANGQSYSSTWSEKSFFKPDDKLDALRNDRTHSRGRRGGWGRVALIAALVIAGIIALAVGLAVGLQSKGKGTKSSSTTASADSDSPTSTTSGSSSSSSSSSTTTSADFPIGSYAFTTFLDTVQTNCTANSATWSCWPYTIYNTDETKSMATFNWIITPGSTSDTYKISSTQNPLAISFSDADLTLVDAGKDSERYTFQITMDKKVIPTTALTDDDSSSACFFNSTTFTAYLYTQMAKNYPSSAEESGSTSTTSSSAYPDWPFAVRAEQTIAGGQDVPNCYKTTNGQIGEQITQGLNATDPTSLCSCLYRNYLTPDPYT